MSELKILFPEPEIVPLGSTNIKIYPVLLRDFERYGKSASALIELFSQADIQQINRYAEKHSAEIRSLLRSTTNLSRWQLWRLPATAAAHLLAEVVRVNSSFFGEALPVMVRALSGESSRSG